MCKQAGARLMGPNCLGLINTHHKMNASFASHMPKAGGISVLSQSGALCAAILDWAAARKLGLATLLSIGNKADLNEIDFLSAFADDDEDQGHRGLPGEHRRRRRVHPRGRSRWPR